MENFVLRIFLKKTCGFLFLIGFLATLHAMDSGVPKLHPKKSMDSVIFQKKVQAWDPEKLVEEGKVSHFYVPKDMIITPDQKGVLYTVPGQVRFVAKDVLVPTESHLMIQHSQKKYQPMIAAAMKQENLLVLVSVLNKQKKELPECVLSQYRIKKSHNNSHNIFSSNSFKNLYPHSNVKSLASPTLEWDDSNNVQAIALSSNGEYVAMGFKNFILLMDLLTEKSYRSIFPQNTSPQTYVVDVSVPVSNFLDKSESHLAAANNTGLIDCKKFTQEEMLMNVKNVGTGDRIANVHLMPEKEVWYVTENGQVNTIDFRTFLEHCDNAIKKRIVSYHEGSNASVDQGLEKTTIHWSNNPQAPDTARLQIHVYRESGTKLESFVIELPDSLHKTYNCVGAQGQKTSAPVLISLAEVRGNSVAAFLTNGEIVFWKLPEKHQAPTEDAVKGLNPTEVSKRKRSLSSPMVEDRIKIHSQTVHEHKEKRKSVRNAPKLTIFGSNESLKNKADKDKTDKTEIKASSPESPRRNIKRDKGTPRKKQSSSSEPKNLETVRSSEEYKDAQQQDYYNDFNRVDDPSK